MEHLLKTNNNNYDVIVVGAGHAGIEAALASAKLACNTLLITINLDNMGQLSCNPSIGGIAKGQIVKEIDALGGIMGHVIDNTMMQFRMLNKSKGKAVWAPRSQADKYAYKDYVTNVLYAQKNLSIMQDIVISLCVENKKIVGVKTERNNIYTAKSVVLTTGTFLNGLIHIGQYQKAAGRIGELPAVGLSDNLLSLGFSVGRLKTGTPARIDKDSIDYNKTEIQHGDDKIYPFSYETNSIDIEQTPCWSIYTNINIHKIIQDNIHLSPLYSGRITGVGPRYCPSIEDKVVRFADKDRHQLFLELESLRSNEVYINGFSSSLPEHVQNQMIHSLVGLEEVKILKPAYAIEYDYVNPIDLYPTLETKIIEGLFHAGQINGTSGYEEAAAQGLIAGINAALKIQERDSFILKRSDAYIGVLIDDLTTKGTTEPYRMFTSQAEYRMILRQDNADERLTKLSFDIGLASEHKYLKVVEKVKQRDKLIAYLGGYYLSKEELLNIGLEKEANEYKSINLANIVKRPQCGIDYIKNIGEVSNYNENVIESAEINIKYEGYIKRAQNDIENMKKYENMKIPIDFDYDLVPSIKTEAKEKLKLHRPLSISQATRISGIDPSVIQALMILLRRL